MNNQKIAIIGCGNLGQSILNGFVNTNIHKTNKIIVTKRSIQNLSGYQQFGIEVTSDNRRAIEESEIIIIALKPYNILNILAELKESFNSEKHIIISLATGVSIKKIENVIDLPLTIYRAMPNTAADINESMTCICSNSSDERKDSIVKNIFNTMGLNIFLNEDLMESATVLAACGIAYVLRFIRAMVQGGIEIGFDANTAGLIVNQVVNGASKLLIEKGRHPESEIDKVTTPKGCTITGINEMEHNGFSSSLIKGIVASYNKIEK